MTWFKNLRIRTKLITGFMIMIIFMVSLALIAGISLRSADRGYSYLLDYPQIRLQKLQALNTSVVSARRLVTLIALNTGDDSEISKNKASLETILADADSLVLDYISYTNNDPRLDASSVSERVAKAQSVQAYINQYRSDVVEPIVLSALDGDIADAKQLLYDSTSLGDQMATLINDMQGIAKNLMDSESVNQTASANGMIVTFILLSVVAVFLAFVVALYISRVITSPISRLVDLANNVAEGNLNVNVRSDSKDETGELTLAFAAVVNNIKKIIMDIEGMYMEHEEGRMDSRIDEASYKGSYKDVALGVNTMVHSYILMLEDIFHALTSFGQGVFNIEINKYKGQKAVVNTEVDTLKATINGVVNEIGDIAKAGAKGELSSRANADQFKGQWAQILVGLNDVLIAVAEPIHEAQAVMTEVSQGNFNQFVQGDYKGDFNDIKLALNGTVSSISSYIVEITEILGLISKGDLRTSIKRDYNGQFSNIKESINTIINVLNSTMAEIASGSDQLLAGARQISESAMTLAQGATEQASSVQELTASMDTINEQTQGNASNADKANELSIKSTENAQRGNKEMESMLASMNVIKEASNSISKIIKVIDDIAFQTNLLALNAAVEAARAGEHGKGFAVVAEEVRNLASRSQNAAKETTGLIEDSINKVNEGTKIAQATAGALDIIVDNAKEVSTIISEILQSSNEQASSISQVTIGLEQISQVVQNNSSTSEESAAASQELNSQAEMLKKMVSFFQI